MITGFIFNYHSMTLVGLGNAFLAYLVSLLPLLVLVLGIILLTHLLKSGISVFFVAVLLFAVAQVISLLFPQYSGLLISTHLGWYKLWVAHTFPIQVVIRELFLMVGYAMMLFVASFYLFERKEF